MVMRFNNAWNKNNRREIKHTFERYIAILAIITLGVGFFSGLKITKSAMVKTLDTFVTDLNMYDFRLLSTLGFTKEDPEYFQGLEEVTAVEGAYSLDFITNFNGSKEIVLKGHSITKDLNQLKLVKGKMPSSNKECVVDDLYFTENDIGKTFTISLENEEDTIDSLTSKEFTIVGIVKSVNYINAERGTTKVGGGSIDAFIYMPEDAFNIDYYTEIFIKLPQNGKIYSDEYTSYISSKEDLFANELDYRANLRYEDIVNEATEKLNDAEQEYNEGYEEYLSEKADAESKLAEAWEKLSNAKEEIQENEKKLLDSENQIEDARKELDSNYTKYEKSVSDYEAARAETLATFKAKQEDIDNNRNVINSAIKEIENSGVIAQYNQLTETIASLEQKLSQITDHESSEYITTATILEQANAALLEIKSSGVILQYDNLQNNLMLLDAGQKELDAAKEIAISQLNKSKKQLDDGKNQLDSAKSKIKSSKKEIDDGWKALEEGKEEYNKGLKEYEDGKKEAEEGFAEAEKELADAKIKIEDARKDIADIPKPTAYVFDRSFNLGYTSFDNDSSIVDGIAKVLPIFFFLVAALVCSTTMTRMVDEQRTQIGTLKALGYGNSAISRKYMFYSGSAAVIGCILGYSIGTKLFPVAIWKAYNMLYDFAPLEYVFDIWLALISLAASLLCSVGVTYLSCKNELTKMPAELIRPKSPKAGKRVFLERLPFIWKRIHFLHKVSIRNILRYKKRFFMTVLGVAGCTALVLAALGIGDSISNIGEDQFGNIMIYDYEIYFSKAQSKEQMDDFKEEHSDKLSQSVFVSTETMEVLMGNMTQKANIVATDDPNITSVIGFYHEGKSVPYPEKGKVVINNRLAQDTRTSIGDTITIKLSDTENVEVEVGGIFENYVNNYIFMTGETYESIFNEECLYENAYATTKNEDLYSISASISKSDNVASVSIIDDIRNSVENMMQSLDYIIWLVIACAGALAFVVMYNLNNINITERTREIATIKVLGFYSFETHTYVFRENLVLTSIGALFGLLLGKLLHMFIMDQIKVAAVAFKEQIFTASYISAIIVTFVLTFIVNLILKRKIDNINMAESLKSVE